MANDLIVVMPASCVRGTMAEYLDQLREAGIDYWIEDVSQAPWLPRGMHIDEKLKYMREMIQRFSHYEFMIFSCAHDVTFYGSKEEVISKISTTHVLQAAEKNCYPDASLIPIIPNKGPWSFANGGLTAGTPQMLAEWCLCAESHPRYHPQMLDQQLLNILLAERSPLCVIDSQTELFFCLFGGYPELEWLDGKPLNLLTKTKPQFLHANGKWDTTEAFRRRDESRTHIDA